MPIDVGRRDSALGQFTRQQRSPGASPRPVLRLASSVRARVRPQAEPLADGQRLVEPVAALRPSGRACQPAGPGRGRRVRDRHTANHQTSGARQYGSSQCIYPRGARVSLKATAASASMARVPYQCWLNGDAGKVIGDERFVVGAGSGTSPTFQRQGHAVRLGGGTPGMQAVWKLNLFRRVRRAARGRATAQTTGRRVGAAPRSARARWPARPVRASRIAYRLAAPAALGRPQRVARCRGCGRAHRTPAARRMTCSASTTSPASRKSLSCRRYPQAAAIGSPVCSAAATRARGDGLALGKIVWTVTAAVQRVQCEGKDRRIAKTSSGWRLPPQQARVNVRNSRSSGSRGPSPGVPARALARDYRPGRAPAELPRAAPVDAGRRRRPRD